MLKPTQRIKKRYIALRPLNTPNFNLNELRKSISRYLFNFFGEKEFGKLHLKFIEDKRLKRFEKIIVIRVNRELYYDVLASLSFSSQNFRIIPIVSSGTIQSLAKRLEERFKDL